MPADSVAQSQRFEAAFGARPTLRASVPGRVNLIGEHVDYQEGLVMPAAIDRYVEVLANQNLEGHLRIASLMVDMPPVCCSIDDLHPMSGVDSWANYVIGVLAAYQNQHDVSLSGLDLLVGGNLPVGAGVSSSAALETATALIIESLSGIELPALERALLCQSAEHEFAGVPCGIMDQLTVNCGVAGGALLIECRTLEIRQQRLPESLALVVVDSGVKHALANGEYGLRKVYCEDAARVLGVSFLRDASMEELCAKQSQLSKESFRCARHVITEIDRVRQFEAALDTGNVTEISDLMAASHRSLRDDFVVSCDELDCLVETANLLEVSGSRMMGGGFGGSTINLVEKSRAEEFAAAICQECQERHDFLPKAFVANPVAGAGRAIAVSQLQVSGIQS